MFRDYATRGQFPGNLSAALLSADFSDISTLMRLIAFSARNSAELLAWQLPFLAI